MMNKRIGAFIIFALLLALILNFGLATHADAPQFNVTINNEVVNFTNEMGYPYFTDTSRTMVPVRIIIENMGYKVDWDNDTQTVYIENKGQKIELQIGKNTAIVNGKTVPIDVQDGKPVDTKATLVPVKGSKRTYVPLRFISETMGAEVLYEKKNSIHHISINIDKKDKLLIQESSLKAHFIDVGQGDAILITQDNHSMLIDAGDNKYEKTVVDYLKKQGIKKLDYVIGTHPHADHIGGLDAVIDAFEIGKVIMPKVENTTKTFLDVLTSIKNKGLKVTAPNIGDIYKLGKAEFIIVAPNSEKYSDLNNYSVVTKMEYEKTSFLFTGDAEVLSEKEILNNKINIEADVLKVGHHGSDTSSSVEFLDTVKPKYAVIQVGEGNKYGHPSIEIMNRLEKRHTKVYRNDLNGNIIAISDGNEIIIIEDNKTEKISKENKKYIGNINSKVFHIGTCGSLPMEKNRVYFDSIEEAVKAGYSPCSKCNPK